MVRYLQSKGANLLGKYLQRRRIGFDVTALGIQAHRRRIAGLRRDEAAQRAGLSIIDYTWLEQGRDESPPREILERLADAFLLNEIEREHLFLLAQSSPPEVPLRESDERVTAHMQRVLDGFSHSAAYITTRYWDILAWNNVAEVVFADFIARPESERNLLRFLFCQSQVQNTLQNWESIARSAVASFRAQIAESGSTRMTKAFIAELAAVSPDFQQFWAEHDIKRPGDETWYFEHPTQQTIPLEFSAFLFEARPNLTMVVYNAQTPEDILRIKSLLQKQTSLCEFAVN